MKVKTIVASLIVGAMVLSGGATAAAYNADPGIYEVAPCYELLTSAVPMLSFDGATAQCDTNVIAYPTVTKITAKMTLQKFWGLWVWNDVSNATWTKSAYDSDLAIYGNKTVTESGTYRVKTTITLTNSDGSTETVTVYSLEEDITI